MENTLFCIFCVTYFDKSLMIQKIVAQNKLFKACITILFFNSKKNITLLIIVKIAAVSSD
jgi:hypothetical protein